MNYYKIGFEWEPASKEDNGWNGIMTVRGLKNARKHAEEIEKEYGEKPIIKRL